MAQASGQDAYTGKSPVANLGHTGKIISLGGFGNTREASGSGWGGECLGLPAARSQLCLKPPLCRLQYTQQGVCYFVAQKLCGGTAPS